MRGCGAGLDGGLGPPGLLVGAARGFSITGAYRDKKWGAREEERAQISSLSQEFVYSENRSRVGGQSHNTTHVAPEERARARAQAEHKNCPQIDPHPPAPLINIISYQAIHYATSRPTSWIPNPPLLHSPRKESRVYIPTQPT